MGDWPGNAAAVDAAWMDAVLHRSGVLSTARVRKVTAANLGLGIGIMGEVSRLTIDYDRPEPGAPASVIAKFPTADPVNLGVARALFLYPREIAFYTRLATHAPIRTPRLLHAELDLADHSFALLLEDLRDATPGDQIAGLTPAQAEAAITALARLHGGFWGKVDAGDMTALFDFASDPYGMAVQAGYQGFLAPALGNFADCYSDYTKKTAEGLAPVAARVIKDLSSGVRSFVHGDYRADNLMFGPALGEDGVAAVDWQISGRGGPLYDVAYLICNSLPTAYRQQAEKALLQRYHDTLVRMGVDGFSFAECWQSYRLAVLCGLFVVVFTTGGMDLGNQRGLEMARAVARRVDAAVRELQVGDLLPA
ncbi:phosphotransferase [Reyranella sp.]|uniref:phosphotransferase n=1 Tax=Reyranella sp. TaxID=1929291 RepID=UPI003BAB2589